MRAKQQSVLPLKQALLWAHKDLPVGEHCEGPVLLNQVPHHADFLRAEELQGQGLPGDQHHDHLRQHRDDRAAVVIVQSPPVELLHVGAQVLRGDRGQTGNRNTCSTD